MNAVVQPGKTALITGAARRIGKALALGLSAAGYRIALHYHSSAKDAQAVREQIRQQGGGCEVFACDLEDETAASLLIERVRAVFPDLGLLINNASVYSGGDLRTEDLAVFNRNFNVNFKAPYILTREFARQCRVGHVINILDANMTRNRSATTSYLLSKKALAALTGMTAVALAPLIRVNAVAPGLILPPEGKKEDYLERLSRGVPLQKTGSPEHLIRDILFLVANDNLTGQIIFEDGGMHL